MRGWLTTIVARLSLDELRARKARREESADASSKLSSP
jgi:DNA-directed RNA polymerase specialized sigma24 family protein